MDGVVNPTGGAAKFARFINDELFPFVTDNYRTKNADRAVYGHSFGGLFAMYIFLNETLMFDKYLVLSPSLWWDNKTLFHDIDGLKSVSSSGRCYIASGALELNIDDDQREFDKLLYGLTLAGLHIRSEILENETHRTIFGSGFTRGLRYLYAKTMEDQRDPAR